VWCGSGDGPFLRFIKNANRTLDRELCKSDPSTGNMRESTMLLRLHCAKAEDGRPDRQALRPDSTYRDRP